MIAGSLSEFTSRLVADLQGQFPPELTANSSRVSALRRKGVESLLKSLGEYRTHHPFGMLKRLIFARNFQRALFNAGYSGEFVRQVTAAALVELTAPKK